MSRGSSGLSAKLSGALRNLGFKFVHINPVPVGKHRLYEPCYDRLWEYFQRQCLISADPDDPGIKQMIETIGDNNVLVATDFGHPEGRHYSRAVDEVMGLEGVSEASKRKIMWDNALKLYPIRPN